MSDQAGSISQALHHLNGRPAWGLTRTHGSMFFLEVGNPKLRPGEKKQHGEWHFLFEMCHWRFECKYRSCWLGRSTTAHR